MVAEVRRSLVPVLAVTQTVGYGVLYYAFAVVLRPVAADLGASTTTVTGALTVAVLVSAAAAVPIGRWLDRRGGRGLMAAGSVLGAVAVAGWSQAQTVLQLYLAFVAIGLASAMVLYEAAFAVVVAVTDRARRRGSVLAITLVAGFASSVFIPLTGALTDRLGWRDAVLVLAAIQALTAPLHLMAVPGEPAGRTVTPRSWLALPLRERAFWLLVAAFAAHTAALAALSVHLVGYLVELGHSPVRAAAMTGLLGVLSVTGRLVSSGLTRWLKVTTVTAAVFAVQALAAGALPLVGRSAAGAVTCVVGFGLGFGVATIARPVILADRYGTRDYGTIAGLLAAPATVAKAVGPLVAAALAAALGFDLVAVLVGATCLLAAGCLVASRAEVSPRGGP